MTSTVATCAWVAGCAAGAGVIWLRDQAQQARSKSDGKQKSKSYRTKKQPKDNAKEPVTENFYGDLITYRAIGECRSIFPTMRGVPRQGLLAPSTKATVMLYTNVSAAALEGLEQFSHVWLVFVFSRNTNAQRVDDFLHRNVSHPKTFPGKIRPPLLGGKRTGLLSTRTPHRPNPIGLTLCEIVSVNVSQRSITVTGVDLCDRTPILDIKPFIPPDRAQDASFAPWLDEKPLEGTDPTLVHPTTALQRTSRLAVRFSDTAMEGLTHAMSRRKQKSKKFFYKSVDEAEKAIAEILGLDIRGVNQGRANGGLDESVHRFKVDGLALEFHMESLTNTGDVTGNGSIGDSPSGDADDEDGVVGFGLGLVVTSVRAFNKEEKEEVASMAACN